ncbi:MAG: DUF2791 family P-loop domain-containing protein [Chloroflexi bacterium]|nr:DUF2791 family P-loop domain-containing protein [Chloroflexota bacterium]
MSFAAGSRDVFVGREREMAALTAALEDMIAGHARIVMLVGEPGIGKTRTADRLASEARQRGVVVLWGRCSEERGAPPYWPWSQILGGYVRQQDVASLASELGRGAAEVASIVPEISEKLPKSDPLPAIADPEAARFRLFDSVARFLAKAQENSALLLIFDNLHLCDVASLRLLEYLSLGPPETRTLILGTYRDIELSRGHPLSTILGELAKLPGFRRIPLRGLDRNDVKDYIEAIGAGKPPSDLVDVVHSHTEGNPFFVAEVVRLLDEQAVLSTSSKRVQWQSLQRIPEGVKEAIGRRLDRLPADGFSVLSAASVIGREFQVSPLERLLEGMTRDQILQALDVCRLAGLVERGAGAAAFRFTHALVQQSVAAELSSSAKARMHARVAQVLEMIYGSDADSHAAELAYHYAESELVLGTEKLVRYSILAAEQALRARAHEEAAEHFQMVLEAKASARPDMETARCWLGLVRALSSTTEVERLVKSMKGAIECCLAIGHAEGIVEGVGLRLSTTVADQVIDATSRCLESIPPGTPLAIRLLALRAGALGITNQEAAADRDLASAIEGALASPDVRLRREVVARAARVNFSLARWGQMLSLVDRLSSFGIDADEVPHFAVWAYLAEGKPMDGLRISLRGRESGERSADWFVYWAYSRFASRAAHSIGDFEQARAVLPANPRTLVQAEALAALAWLDFEQGHVAQGTSHLEEFVKWWSRASPPIHEDLSAACALVRAYQIAGDQPPAITALDLARKAAARGADERANSFHASLAHSVLACIVAIAGDKRQAESVYRALFPIRGTYLTAVQAAADRLLGQLARICGKPELARSHFESALGFCRTAGYVPELAWTIQAYSDLLLETEHSRAPASADLARASELVADGVELASRLGMLPLESRLREQMAMVEALQRLRARYPGGLTEREVDVLRLIAAGMSNREIAGRLTVSVYTVNRHVANIFGKIGVANRAEAATYAGKHGLLA